MNACCQATTSFYLNGEIVGLDACGFFFFPGCCLFLAKLRGMWGILDPRPGIDPMPAVLEARSLNHGATREVSDAWF